MQCEIARKFFDMISAIAAEQKIPLEYSNGQMLYHAEMDFLEKIEEFPQSNVSWLSKQSGVTKSATTQMSAKLLEKGLIESYQSPKNKKEKYFRLTAEGHAVRVKHMEYHKAAVDGMREYLCSLEGKEKKTILEFLEQMKNFMPVYVFACQCGVRGRTCMTEEKGNEEEQQCWS